MVLIVLVSMFTGVLLYLYLIIQELAGKHTRYMVPKRWQIPFTRILSHLQYPVSSIPAKFVIVL